MNQEKVYIATYGSLRLDMQNFHVNNRGGGQYIGTGKTEQNYDLFRYGGSYFPSVSLTHSENNKPVVVDVFEAPVSGLTGAYDGLEGYPHFYNRTQIPVILEDGHRVEAWIYHIDEKQPTPVVTGDWCEYVRPNYYQELADKNDK